MVRKAPLPPFLKKVRAGPLNLGHALLRMRAALTTTFLLRMRAGLPFQATPFCACAQRFRLGHAFVRMRPAKLSGRAHSRACARLFLPGHAPSAPPARAEQREKNRKLPQGLADPRDPPESLREPLRGSGTLPGNPRHRRHVGLRAKPRPRRAAALLEP